MKNEAYIIDELGLMYNLKFGCQPQRVMKLAGAGSDRVYWRLISGENSAIGTFCSDRLETGNFISIQKQLKGAGFKVPEIYGINSDNTIYLQEDLGHDSLYDLILGRGDLNCVGNVMITLAKMHKDRELANVAEECNGIFSRDAILNDLHYFKFCFLKPLSVETNDIALDREMATYADRIMNIDRRLWGFMYRDCQSRNIYVDSAGNPVWIDFQGARKGPSAYDVVSFLWQAKANFADDFRRDMLSVYIAEFTKDKNIARMVAEAYRQLVPFRVMQTLGAYGFRGLIEGKSHFITSIRGGIENFSKCADFFESCGFSELLSLPAKIKEAWHSYSPFATESLETLTLRVESFSYRKGYPPELSGNGGGFVFDCRYMHNPGRYEEYRSLTGLDKPVIEFLEDKNEAHIFVEECIGMVSKAVNRYLQRGFTNLFVGFGCTGGQHRSVYCAEHFAEAMKHLFPAIRVEVYHRIQSIYKII